MKKLWMILLVCVLVASFVACKNSGDAETPPMTAPQETADDLVTAPSAMNPFEFESEIDFSDFETGGVTETDAAEQPSEPNETVKPTVKPTEPVVEPTEPEDEPTEPELTEPEETTTAAPSLGSDGYNNQIVRP